VWLFVLWSIVAGAICRTHAVRIARDESLSVGDGLAFSLGNLRSFLLAPLFAALGFGIFLGVTALAGAAGAVPYAGAFLSLVLHPLALVTGLLATLIAIGGVFGFPLMQAALATERNGVLDAVSRTFSYVFTRPVSYLVSVSLVTIVSIVITAFGGMFLVVTGRAMLFGASWNGQETAPFGPGGGMAKGMQFAASGGVLAWPSVPEGMDTATSLGMYVAWAFTALAILALNGFVLSYFVGGLTDTYFLLRREVDGIDDSEIYTEGAEASLGEPLPGEPSPPPARTS
jgi:hypothetical protein